MIAATCHPDLRHYGHGLCEPCYKAEYRARHPARLAAALLSGCVDCGAAGVHFHHLDPSTKRYNVSEMNTSSAVTFAAEIAKCVVLCNACHRERHRTGQLVRQGE